MGERDTASMSEDSAEDLFEPGMGEISDEDLDSLDFAEAVTEKALKAAKRRRAEERLEMLRLREELGDYDLDFEDGF
ncbi:MAG: hypothetical protein EBY45_11975 [Gammaproteobacteria bacterium]|nr:hypothetical protein [Gammaproteobacteria bacterium]